MKKKIFIDADDTLWENERHFREAEARFSELMAPGRDPSGVQRVLWQKQEENIPLFGYGSKTYLIGMVDAAIDYAAGSIDRERYAALKKIICDLVLHPLHIFPEVPPVLEKLAERFDLIMVTKGDAVEQMRKVEDSGLKKYFRAVEVVRFKDEKEYMAVADKYDVPLQDMVMVGDSVKSDIIPVLNLGGTAIHVPHRVVWDHEMAPMPVSDRLYDIKSFSELLDLL